MSQIQKEHTLAVTGVSLLSLLTLIISSTTDQSWPPSFSNLLADTSTPQARLFFTFGFLAGICLLQSWVLYLPPHNSCEAFRHIAFCIGIIMVSTIPTSTNKFHNFQSDDVWEFTLHMTGIVLAFVIHPIYELLGATDIRCTLNKYRTDRGKGRIRFCLSFTSLLLSFIFIVLLIIQGLNYEMGMYVTSFIVEIVLIIVLLVDAWFIVLNEEELRREY